MEVCQSPAPPTSGIAAVMVEIVNSDYRCHPCVAICNTRQMLEAHLSGKKHVAKIALCGGATAFKPLTDLPDLPPRESKTLTPTGRKRKNVSAQGHFRCDICEIDFDSAFPFEAHMQGRKHMNKAQKKEQGDTPGDMRCEICSVSAPDKDAYDAHVNGKKHLAKVAFLEKNGDATDFKCDVCAVTATSAETLKTHLEGKRHLAKVGKASVGEGGSKEPAETFHCEFCNVSVNNKEIFDSHRNGKKHAEKVRKIAEGDGEAKASFMCDICNVSAPCQDTLDLHLKGKKHLKKINYGLLPEPGAAPASAPATPKKGVDSSLYFCQICSVQMNGPAMMESHLGGKSHMKKAAAANEQNASALATSFVKSIREQADSNGSLTGVKLEESVAEPQAQEVSKQPPAAPIPALASNPAATASPARTARSKRAN